MTEDDGDFLKDLHFLMGKVGRGLSSLIRSEDLGKKKREEASEIGKFANNKKKGRTQNGWNKGEPPSFRATAIY